jgi:hypothetical protein
MNTQTSSWSLRSWISRKKWILIAIAVPLLVAAWWAFRPEKLWINQRVSEPVPFTNGGEPQPLFTGLLEGKVHETSGRATIYKSSDGKKYLRLTDFMTSNGPDVHVLLARGGNEDLKKDIVKDPLDSVELGTLKANQGDQNYDLTEPVDLNKYNAVVIYCKRFHAVFGVAGLEQF